MIPPTMAHLDLVILERAHLAARLEKKRIQRDRANHLRIRSRAARRGGTTSLRVRAGTVLMRTGAFIAGQDWMDGSARHPVSAAR